jgi:hypothetical protein
VKLEAREGAVTHDC